MFLKVNFGDLFPTRRSVVVFIAYMTLFVNQGLLVTATQDEEDNAYSYNTVLVVLLTECVKLSVSIMLFCGDHSVKSLFSETLGNSNIMLLYFIPAFLYCLYNNLAFINLSAFDPTTYFLLLQLRVVVTGVLFQIMFRRQLSAKQWISLIVLTIGCVIKHIQLPEVISDVMGRKVEGDSHPATNHKLTGVHLGINMFLILVQVICSCLAGVYNEFLLKRQGADVNIFIQNIYMYLDSIICNAAILLCQGELHQVVTPQAINSIISSKVSLVIINNAAIGIVTSLFLQSLNSIVKTFASALELVFTAVLSWLIFDIPIYTNTICAILVVSLAVIVYSQNPISNNMVINVPKEKEQIPV